MRDFSLPFKPEELLAQPSDGRLWASDLPPVDEWSEEQAGNALDALIGRLLSTQGYDLAEDESFSLVFALLQAWPRLEDGIHSRVIDLLADAARRIGAEVGRLKKAEKVAAKQKEQEKQLNATREARTASKVAAFCLRWAAERVMKQAPVDGAAARGRGRGGGKAGGRGGGANAQAQDASAEEAREALKVLERQRCTVMSELSSLICKGAMPWLWIGDPGAWQQVAQAVSDAGFLLLDNAEAMKHREARQLALRCITDPLLQEGHQHSNLLVATVSKLMHGLRGGETGAPFAADALLLAHATPLPRSFLVELTQHCNPAELTSQGAFQRALGAFLVAVSERLPHVVLANISVLLPLLDVDCYPLRSAIVEGIGQLLSAEGKKLPSGARCSAGSSSAGSERGGEQADGTDGRAAADGGEAPPGESEEGPVVAGKRGGAAGVPEVRFKIADATKKDLLETLMSRTLDKSVWVRYRALQTLISLASNTRTVALPRDLWARVLEIATRRMQDTASSTRKASMQLVRTLIEFHPYGPALQGSGDERNKSERLLQEVAARLQKLRAEEIAEVEEAAAAAGVNMHAADADTADADMAGTEQDDGDEQSSRRRLGKKTMTEQTIVTEIDQCIADADEGGGRAEERKNKVEALNRMRDCYSQRVHFVELIDAAEARLRTLLVSRTVTDVTESISVVVELKLRGVPAAACAFDQVLGLVWSRHASIKDAAVDAFYRMHLEGRDAADAVHALLDMYQEGCTRGSWTYTHLASVQELIQQAAEKELIEPKLAIPELVGALQGPTCPLALRTLTALGAASAGELALVLPRIAKLLGPGGPGLGSELAQQLENVRLLCLLLQRLHACAKVPLGDEAWGHIWALSQHAIHMVAHSFAGAHVPPQWFGAAQAAMDLSFDLSMSATAASDPAQRCPDKLWEQIVNRMLCGLLNSGAAAVPPVSGAPALADAPRSAGGSEASDDGAEPAEAAVTDVVASKPDGAPAATVVAPQVGCVVFLAGHLALRMVIYLEGLLSALKRKRLAEEDARAAEQRDNSKKKTKKGKGAKAEEEDAGAQASSLGMAGQEERENDAFADMAEHGLLYGSRSFLDRVKPLILSCLLSADLRKDPVLRRLGAISLCKYMTVSKRFCEENLQLLFSVLFPKQKEGGGVFACAEGEEAEGIARDGATGLGALLEDVTLRQSLLVAVGDLLFRHPNVVEPWTGRLYGALSSPEGPESSSAAELRLTALLVLTHLVLNDMMKPRAVLLVRTLWLTACEHQQTARVARILFQELSKRSTNVVYNLIPEIIARLPEHQGAAGQVAGGAEGRVQYIMQFIEKERHIEGLIEKLAVRLEQSANAAGGKSRGASEPVTDPGAESAGEALEDSGPPTRAMETVSCLAHALGSMNYTDRCILRLHDAVVVRKALQTAISYHPVTRECLLGVVEKARRPRPGKEKAAEGPADPEAAAASGAAAEGGGQKGGASAAAAAALDAIEQTVTRLAKGQDVAAEAPVPIANGGPTPAAPSDKGGKQKAEAKPQDDTDNPGFEDEGGAGKAAQKKGKGRGRGAGRGRGRGRGPAEEKENHPAAGANTGDGGHEKGPHGGDGDELKAAGKRGPGCGRGAANSKRRRAVRSGDGDDEE